MTQKRMDLINNSYLGKKGFNSGLQFFLKTERTHIKNWIPPNYSLKKVNEDEKDEA